MAEVKVRKHDIQAAKRPDAVLQGATTTFDWLYEHRNAAFGALAAILVLVGGYSAIQSWRQSSVSQVGGQLSDAIALDARPVSATKAGDEKKADDDSFATQADKDKAVDSALTAVTKDHAGTPSALSASLLLASTRYGEGKYDEAISLAQAYLDASPDGSLKALAYETLGNAHAAKKEADKADEAYKKLSDAGQPALALLLQGEIQEKSGKPDEAKKLYEKVVSDYEKEGAAKDARTQLDLLSLPPPGVGALAAPPAPPEDDDAPKDVKHVKKPLKGMPGVKISPVGRKQG